MTAPDRPPGAGPAVAGISLLLAQGVVLRRLLLGLAAHPGSPEAGGHPGVLRRHSVALRNAEATTIREIR
jgi:hypothetical protein